MSNSTSVLAIETSIFAKSVTKRDHAPKQPRIFRIIELKANVGDATKAVLPLKNGCENRDTLCDLSREASAPI
jgi:hypothetical protein